MCVFILKHKRQLNFLLYFFQLIWVLLYSNGKLCQILLDKKRSAVNALHQLQVWCEVITVTANDAATTTRSRTVCADLPAWHLCPTLHCHCDHHEDDGDDDDEDSDDDDDSVRIFEKVFQQLFRAFVQVAECLSTEWKPQWVGTRSNLILTLSHRHRHHHSHHNHQHCHPTFCPNYSQLFPDYTVI